MGAIDVLAANGKMRNILRSVGCVYDLADRLVWSRDPAGIETAYIHDGLTETTIRSGLTNVTVRYMDGQTKYTAQNGVIKSWHDYGVNADGTQWSKSYTGPDGANSPAWSKTTTDMLGHTIMEDRPMFGGGVLTNSYVYNTKGQLTSTTQQLNNSQRVQRAGSADSFRIGRQPERNHRPCRSRPRQRIRHLVRAGR